MRPTVPELEMYTCFKNECGRVEPTRDVDPEVGDP